MVYLGVEHTTTKHAIAYLDPDEPYLWLRPRKPRQPSPSFEHFLFFSPVARMHARHSMGAWPSLPDCMGFGHVLPGGYLSPAPIAWINYSSLQPGGATSAVSQVKRI